MYKIVLTLMPIICLSTGQWMQYIDNGLNPYPSGNPLSEELILQKDTPNIPVFVFLKPRRAKSLTSDENFERRADNRQPLNINQWIGMPDLNSDNIPVHKNNNNQQMIDFGKAFETHQSLSVLPMPSSGNNGEEVVVKGRGDEHIQWPLKGKKPTVSPDTLQQISHLLPKFAALSQSNSELGKLAESSGGSLFEDVLKKFTSNLTDMEHSISGSSEEIRGTTLQISHDKNDGSVQSEDNLRVTSDSPIESKSSENNNNMESNDGIENADNGENSQSYAEQRDIIRNINNENHDIIYKSSPIQPERQIQIPIETEADYKTTETQKGFQPLSEVNKGWLPIKNRKSKEKPRFQERHKELAKNSFANHNQKQNFLFGMPELSTAFPGMLRPRRYNSAFNPSFNPMFDSRNTIRQLPFNRYSSYLSESDISPSLHSLEMHADANKPQHMDPIKAEPVISEHKEHVEEKQEGIIDDKQEVVMEEKHEKHMQFGNGFEGQGHQIACCEILHNLQNKHVVHEEVIGPHFGDEKLIHNLVLTGHKQHHKPIHHKFHHNRHQLPFDHKIGCHPEIEFEHSFDGQQFGGQQQFHWPQHVYRPPHFRPNFGLFSKPLFLG